jgi:catechol 2,3-dioxygenase-like lactoylglutathione lyase family enzyme
MSQPIRFNHVAILVPDLPAAVAQFSKTFGTTFTPPSRMTVPEWEENGVSRPEQIYVAFSTGISPQIELLEASGDGVFSAKHGFGMHHIGGWVNDVDEAIENFGEAGMKPESIARAGHQTLSTYFEPTGMLGVRIEANRG